MGACMVVKHPTEVGFCLSHACKSRPLPSTSHCCEGKLWLSGQPSTFSVLSQTQCPLQSIAATGHRLWPAAELGKAWSYCSFMEEATKLLSRLEHLCYEGWGRLARSAWRRGSSGQTSVRPSTLRRDLRGRTGTDLWRGRIVRGGVVALSYQRGAALGTRSLPAPHRPGPAALLTHCCGHKDSKDRLSFSHRGASSVCPSRHRQNSSRAAQHAFLSSMVGADMIPAAIRRPRARPPGPPHSAGEGQERGSGAARMRRERRGGGNSQPVGMARWTGRGR